MHLAHFIQRYPPALGGSESYFRRLSQHFASHGHSVDVWTSNAFDLAAFWSPSARCLPEGEQWDGPVRIRRYPLWRMRGRRWLLKPLSLIPQRTWQALTLPCNPIAIAMWRDAGRANARYHAVHATAFPYAWPILCARRLARRLGVPFLLTPFLHLGDDPTRRQYTQPALRNLLLSADGVFVQTELERDAAMELGVPAERVVLQGLGVDVSECTGGDRNRARRSWRVSDDTLVIGHLANLSVEKGTVDLVRAAQRLDADAAVVLAGPAMPNYRSFAHSHPAAGPEQRTVETGILTDPQKRDFLAGIDVLALPSRSDSFGLVLLEAWANGVPVVAYDAGGPGELVRHGVDGLLARCGDVADLASRLGQLTRQPELRKQMGEAGRGRLGVEFAWPDKLRIVERLVVEMAAGLGRRSVPGGRLITSSS